MIFLTAADMKTEFLIGYDRVSNSAAPGYDNSEISLFLNKAQERIIKTRYRQLNKYREAFEQTEKRRKDFSELIRDAVDGTGTLNTSISSNQNGTLPNGTFFDLPADFMYSITERIESDIVCDNVNKIIDVSPITHDEYNANKDNPFKKPYSEAAWRIDYSYFLRYLKRPVEIDIDTAVNCELDETVHREIVDVAVEIALETIMDPRFQSKKIDNVEIE
jgi:hypothetical protein